MKNIEALLETIKILRSENGCDWDRAQTHQTIRKNMLEEAYEAVDAIDDNDINHLKEELGDVLLQVVLHCQIASDNNEFTFEDVADTINKKLIHRHPHVFSNLKVKNVDEILSNWEKLKKEEKPHRKSILDGISRAQSALMTAQKMSSKAAKIGFEWDNIEDVMDCVTSEMNEFLQTQNKEDKEMEFGDILFALVNLARWNNIDAEQALIKSNKKFDLRFRKMEAIAQEKGLDLEKLTLDEWDKLWMQAKKETKD